MKHLIPTILTLGLVLVATANGQNISIPNVVTPGMALAPLGSATAEMKLAASSSKRYSAEAYSDMRRAADKRAWKLSVMGVIASQSLDTISSYGMLERNHLLASANGGFGAKAASIKFGTTAAFIGVEYFLLKKYPSAARVISKLNWSSSILTSGLAVHNFAIK